MTQDLPPPSAGAAPTGPGSAVRVGVMDAVRLGWQLLMSDFWTLWLMGFLAMLLGGFSGPGVIVVGPAVTAGLFHALAARADGREVKVGMLFEGFSKRFAESVVAGLVPYGVQFALPLLMLPVHLTVIFGVLGALEEGGPQPSPAFLAGAWAVDVGWALLLMVAGMAVRLLFIFAQCAVWDHPKAGWEAAKESMRLVRADLGAVIGLALLFVLIAMGAQTVGFLACCIGVWFTAPIVQVWWAATVLHLYRSWTGRTGGWEATTNLE